MVNPPGLCVNQTVRRFAQDFFGSPCKPSVQISAHVVEGQVEWLLANPWKIVPAPRKVKRLLSKFSDEWEVLSPKDKTARIRELVWSATWSPDQRNTSIIIDEINWDRIIETRSF